MKPFALRAAVALFLFLCVGIPPSNAEPEAAAAGPPEFDAGIYEWAFGSVIDSIFVSGNEKTATIALLREMESRVGHRLDQVKLERDHRYLGDLSSIATVDIQVILLSEGHCALRVTVTERPTLLLKLMYPIVEYDFNRERFRYGFKLNDRNFRKKLENFSIDFTRNSVKDDNASIGWSTGWLGWQHIGIYARTSYFHRGETGSSLSILEQVNVRTGLSLPLTKSRIAFSQVMGGLSLRKNRLGQIGEPSSDEVLLSPIVGFSYDSRDSRLKPRRGEYFSVAVEASRVINDEGSTYYWLGNDVRVFRPLDGIHVIALMSKLSYQFGKYPEYIRFGLGGAGTLRGYSSGVYRGAHRWIQTLEWRISPFPKWFFRVPFVGTVDVMVAMVFFMDTGIAWNNEKDFIFDHFHGGGGCGLRIYSPAQDAVRLDFGINAQGDAHPYFSTGIRF